MARKAVKKKMAPKRAPKPGKTRYRRSDDEMIADLQRQIEELKQRKKAKEVKASPASKQATAALRALMKGVEMCEGPQDAELKRVLSEAQRVVAGYFEAQGLKVPKARKPRARRCG